MVSPRVLLASALALSSVARSRPAKSMSSQLLHLRRITGQWLMERRHGLLIGIPTVRTATGTSIRTQATLLVQMASLTSVVRRAPVMTIDHGLHVEVHDGKIVVTLPHTAFAAMYDRLANDPHLYAKIFPLEGDPRSEMSQAEFMAHAWGLANRKARELGWVV
jgi:hypothetical protein